VVIYDRHFLFDYVASSNGARATDRFHRWFLERVYSKPDLVLFLDAPPEQLFARKPEVPVSYLEKRRDAYLAQARFVDRFETIDASQPLDDVYQDVLGRIGTLLHGGERREQDAQHTDVELSESGEGR
jgi:thymidylate kinase